MALDDVIDALKVLRPVAKTLPVVGTPLEGGIEAVIQICEFAAAVETNKADSQELANRAAKDIRSIHGALDTAGEHAWELAKDLQDVLVVLHEIQVSLGHRASNHGFLEHLHAVKNKKKTANELKALNTKLQQARDRFMTASQIRQELALHTQAAAQIRQETALDTLISEADQTTLRLLAPVFHGYLDAGETRSGCLEKTRVQLLERLSNWIDLTGDEELVFWLVGLAGTGKSTITTTVAERLDVYNKTPGKMSLAAWFFCSRQDVERRQAANILLTLVYQLALLDPGLRTEICTALRQQPDLPKKQLYDQILSLLQEPLQKLNLSVILVVDALDECEHYGGKLLHLLSTTARALQGKLRLLITSRPERSITQMFQQIGPELYALHDMEKGVVQGDILLYLQYHFGQIKQAHSLQNTKWPSSQQLATLVARSGTLFIYAATVVKFIAQPTYDPTELLQNVLTQPLVDPTQGSPYGDIDVLYTQVLQAAVPATHNKAQRDALAERISATVGTIILLQIPLSVNALVTLLNSSASPVAHDLYSLSAMLLIPTNPAAPVKIFHPSFPDFLTDATRCTDSRFFIDQQDMHTQIALLCLQLMNKELHFNMPGQSTLPYMSSTLSAEEIEKAFSEALQYACKYWMHHIASADKANRKLVSELEEFVEQKILNWVEAASLLNFLPLIITILQEVEQWASDLPNLRDVATTLHDTQRICQVFYPAISKCCIDVYQSAMALGPEIPVGRLNGELPPGWPHVQLVSAKNSHWYSLLQVMNAGSEVNSVSFSQDGKSIVSGSDDRAVRIWDAVTGEQVSVLEGHTDGVTSCSFSRDGQQIVSGSYDKSVRIWDAATGAQVSVLEGHTHYVTSCSFSPDGKQIVSGSDDKSVRIWDAVTGGQVSVLEGHTSQVRSCSFSPDGKHIVSGSEDKTVRIWDAVTGGQVSVLEGHTDYVRSCSFSPDGKHIVSGSEDKTVRMWDAVTGGQVLLLEGHTYCVNSCSFSPDGKHIVSGSHDKTVRIWDAATGGTVSVLKGHTHWITSCSFSPDGKHIVSGANDNTVRIWDAVTGGQVSALEGHTHWVRSCTFSPDGKYIVSGSDDETVRIWDAVTGGQVSVLQGHTDCVNSCSFSPDGKFIVSGSDDDTVRIWDAAINSCLGVISCLNTSLQYLPGSSTLVLCSSQLETPPQVEVLTGHVPGLTMWTVWLDKEGFLYLNSQLICWVTPERLPAQPEAMSILCHGEKAIVVLGSKAGLVTILDVTSAMSQ